MLESNPPGNNQLETHRDDEQGRGRRSRPLWHYIIVIDLLMPWKTHLVISDHDKRHRGVRKACVDRRCHSCH